MRTKSAQASKINKANIALSEANRHRVGESETQRERDRVGERMCTNDEREEERNFSWSIFAFITERNKEKKLRCAIPARAGPCYRLAGFLLVVRCDCFCCFNNAILVRLSLISHLIVGSFVTMSSRN